MREEARPLGTRMREAPQGAYASLAQSTRWSGSELQAQDSDELLTLAPQVLALRSWSDLPATEPSGVSLPCCCQILLPKAELRLTFLFSERAPDCLARGPLQALGTQC